jgi:hypothetical protein
MYSGSKIFWVEKWLFIQRQRADLKAREVQFTILRVGARVRVRVHSNKKGVGRNY